MNNKKYEIKEFDIQNMRESFVAFCVGPPSSGKTSFAMNFAYYNRDKYPVARVFTGNDAGYKIMKKIFGPLYTSNYYDEKEHENLVLRKRICIDENGELNKDNNIFEMFDDFGDDKKILSNKLFQKTLKIGTQHYQQAVFINSQAVVDFKNNIRSSISYIIIFKNDNKDEREKLYRYFGGVCGTFATFCEIMDLITGDYTALVIDLLCQSQEFSDKVFYFKPDDPKTLSDTGEPGFWRFGCDEFWDWQTERYNKDYVESFE